MFGISFTTLLVLIEKLSDDSLCVVLQPSFGVLVTLKDRDSFPESP